MRTAWWSRGWSRTDRRREAGLRRGDVIVEVDRHEVQDTGALEKRLAETDDRALLLVRRGDSQLYVPLKRKS